MARRALAFLALLLLARGGFAQAADRPEVKVGDRWQYAVSYTVPPQPPVPNRTWVVRAVTGDGIDVDEDGDLVRLTRDLNVLDSPRTSESHPGHLRFPLAVGNRWDYTTEWLFKPKQSRGTSRVRVEVAAFESVDVPAGRFEAFRLEAVESLGGKSPIGSVYEGETKRTYWYAPAARAVVKSVSRNPYLGPTTVVLVSLQLQP